jgi:hypothetical protein
VGAENLAVAQLDVQMHEVDAAALRLKTTPVEEKNAPDVAAAAVDRALLAEDKGGSQDSGAGVGRFWGRVCQPDCLNLQS